MTIKWHEEHLGRFLFPDTDGVKGQLFKPLKSKWIPRATGMWVYAWGVAPVTNPTDAAFEVQVAAMSPFQGSESGTSFDEFGGAEDRLTLTGSIGNPGDIGPTTASIWLAGNVGGTAAGFTYSGSAFYDFPNMGASYSSLAIQLAPHSVVDSGEEPPVTYTGIPTWAAARILYRVEH